MPGSLKMSLNNKLDIDYEKLRKEYNIHEKIIEAKKEDRNLVLKLEENSRGLYEIRIYEFFDWEVSNV